MLHFGPFNSDKVTDLGDARAELLGWARGQGIEWSGSRTAHDMAFEACIERYLTDPRGEPDWSKWETELAYLISDTP